MGSHASFCELAISMDLEAILGLTDELNSEIGTLYE